MKELTPRIEEKLAKEETKNTENALDEDLKTGHKRIGLEPLCIISLSTCSEFPGLNYKDTED